MKQKNLKKEKKPEKKQEKKNKKFNICLRNDNIYIFFIINFKSKIMSKLNFKI